MRVVGGTARGRKLLVPAGRETRPTSDRVRQAIFDVLMHAPWAGPDMLNGLIIDAFAGTGALGIEALSRGAPRAIFFETSAAAVRTLRANLAHCGFSGTVHGNVLTPPRGEPASVIFLDPPYGQGLVPHAIETLTTAGWIDPDTLIVAETERGGLDGVAAIDRRVHGQAEITLWRMLKAA